jgi:hypothetical protein
VGTTLVPLDSIEAWVLSDWPVSCIAFNSLFSKHVSDEKGKMQTPSFCGLSYSVVHSFPEFVNLPPYDLGNGAPKALVERVQSTEEQVLSLGFVSQGTHIILKHNVNEPKLRRNLRLAGGIMVSVCILPLTHVENNILDSEHGGANSPRLVRFRRLIIAFQSSRYVDYGHLHVSIVDGRDKNVWPAVVVPQMLIKSLDQMFVCGGGDGFEQPFQATVLHFLNRPLRSLILGEVIFDGERGLQDELLSLNGGPDHHGLGFRGPRGRKLPLGMLEVC